ncbi:hypothetical protein KY325_03420 [Candidatus Woesearchaeota archaeon]|nr:hypothetical protein [Candidatus Woesearchaeota archaeon]MBW3018183.1 hypothetical protein [Candidatus Woesearchaeota archaeon]
MNKPEKQISTGSVQATIWNNAKGNTSYKTISLTRRYKDQNGKWQSSNSLRLNDLPKAQLALAKAYEYLVLREGVEESIEEELVL